jgi:RNA polymerase sigma-70 factor, ECF subfamily
MGMRMDNAHLPDIRELRANDARAWTRFFAGYDPLIRSIAGWPRWHFDAHTSEDAVQTIRLGIVHSIGQLRSETAMTAFVRRIAVNRCIDLLRKQLRLQARLTPLGHVNADGEWEEMDAPASGAYDPVQALQRAERAALLRTAMQRLDETERTCLNQFYVEGLSYREMAERQGVAINTVGSRLSRCLDKLSGLLDPVDAAPEP